MKDKVLCLLDMEWIHFGIVSYFQKNHDCELYGIIDIDNYTKDFFKNQHMISFKKKWFYRDFISNTNNKPDIEFLTFIEKKYKINLWKIAYAERFFTDFNPFYNFKHDEILCILEKECRLFDQIFEEIHPNFLIIKMTDSHQSQLLHEMAKNFDIKVLMMGPTRLGAKYMIYESYEKIEDLNNSHVVEQKIRTKDEVQNYVTKRNMLKTLLPKFEKEKSSNFLKFKKYFEYLSLSRHSKVKSYYANYGKSPLRIILQFIFIKRKFRQNFIDNNLQKSFSLNCKYAYFPLHVEPERQLLVGAPFYSNQLEIIRNVARSLPIDMKLFVKEHPGMMLSGWHQKSFYKKIMNLPNVTLFHPNADGQKLIDKSLIVITINGTTGFEAVTKEKPVIVFADVSYKNISSVHRIKSFEELPSVIRSLLTKKTDFISIDNYLKTIERNSFDVDLQNLRLEFKNYFSREYLNTKSNIVPQQMEKFLKDHKPEFELIALEHIKKLKKLKNLSKTSNSMYNDKS